MFHLLIDSKTLNFVQSLTIWTQILIYWFRYGSGEFAIDSIIKEDVSPTLESDGFTQRYVDQQNTIFLVVSNFFLTKRRYANANALKFYSYLINEDCGMCYSFVWISSPYFSCFNGSLSIISYKQ